MLKKIIMPLCLVSILWASALCAEGNERKPGVAEETFVGQTTDVLIQEKGSPSTVVVFPTGDSVWTYKLLKTGVADCADPAVEASGKESAKIAWMETEIYLIDPNHRIKNYSATTE